MKKAEHQRIDAFELWRWRWLLRVPWTARRSNQSILKEISPWISLEGMMLKLKLQYFDHLMQIVDKKLWCWEGLGAGGEGDDRGWDSWMESPAQWTWVSVNSGCWWRTGKLGVLRFMGSQRVRHDWASDLIWSDQFPDPWTSLPNLEPPTFLFEPHLSLPPHPPHFIQVFILLVSLSLFFFFFQSAQAAIEIWYRCLETQKVSCC